MTAKLAPIDNLESENLSKNPNSAEGAHAITMGLLSYVAYSMPEIARYVEDSAGNIVEEFRNMAVAASTQAENIESVMELTKFVRVQDENIQFERCIDILYQPLSDALNNILGVSKLAMQMVLAVSKAADNIKRVEKFISEIQDITKQTNMLAMNTQIEAARAGEAGKSFQFIAGEVKNLSQDIKNLSEAMQKDISEVSEAVRESSKVVDNLANYNMVGSLDAKDRIDAVVEAIRAQNSQYSALLENAAKMNRDNAANMNRMVMNIQFQDRTNQIIGDWVYILGNVKSHLESNMPIKANQLVGASYDAIAENSLSDVRLTDIRKQAISYLYEKGVLGYESQLVQKNMLQEGGITSNSAFNSDEGDIELF